MLPRHRGSEEGRCWAGRSCKGHCCKEPKHKAGRQKWQHQWQQQQADAHDRWRPGYHSHHSWLTAAFRNAAIAAAAAVQICIWSSRPACSKQGLCRQAASRYTAQHLRARGMRHQQQQQQQRVAKGRVMRWHARCSSSKYYSMLPAAVASSSCQQQSHTQVLISRVRSNHPTIQQVTAGSCGLCSGFSKQHPARTVTPVRAVGLHRGVQQVVSRSICVAPQHVLGQTGVGQRLGYCCSAWLLKLTVYDLIAESCSVQACVQYN